LGRRVPVRAPAKDLAKVETGRNGPETLNQETGESQWAYKIRDNRSKGK